MLDPAQDFDFHPADYYNGVVVGVVAVAGGIVSPLKLKEQVVGSPFHHADSAAAASCSETSLGPRKDWARALLPCVILLRLSQWIHNTAGIGTGLRLNRDLVNARAWHEALYHRRTVDIGSAASGKGWKGSTSIVWTHVSF